MLVLDDSAKNLEKSSNQHPTRFVRAIFRPVVRNTAVLNRHIPLSSLGPHVSSLLAPQILHTGSGNALKINRKLNAGTVNILSAPKLCISDTPSNDSDAREIMRLFCITFFPCDSEDSPSRTEENECADFFCHRSSYTQCAATGSSTDRIGNVASCVGIRIYG